MASYTRQSSFSDGDTITAALFNNEYNQLLTAFSYASSGTTGHRHDGTAGEGGHVHTIGDQDFLNKIVADSTNNRWGVFVQVSSSAVEQIRIQDGAIVPVTDNDIDLGTSSLEFKDAYFDGTVTTDALVADTADINGGTVDGATIGASSATTGVFTTIQGSTITATTAFVPDASDGAALGTSALEFSDLFLADGAVINFGDDQDVSLTHVVDTGLLISSTDQLQFGDSGTYIHQSADGVLDLVSDTEIELTATTIDINGAVAMDGAITGGTNITISGELDAATLDISGNADIDGTTNLDAVDIDGAVQIDATVTVGVNDTGYDVKFFGDTASAYMLWDASTDDLVLAGNAGIDLAGDIDVDGTANLDIVDIDGAVDMASTLTLAGNADFNGNLDVDGTTNLDAVDIDGAVDMASTLAVAGVLTGASLDISGNIDIDGTSNLDVVDIDGAVDMASTLTLAGNADFNGDLDVDGTSNLDIVDIDGAVDMASTLTVAGNVSVGGDLDVTGSFDMSDANITNIGSIALDTITNDGTDITLDSSGDIILDAGGADIRLKDDGTQFGRFANSSSDFVVASSISDEDILFQGNDGGSTITALTLDMSEAGAATFNNAITSGAVITSGAGLVIADAGNIGSASDTDAIAISSGGVVTMNQIPVFSAGINVSGGTIAGTLATAAQGNVTSLGTLTALTVDDVVINGATIGHGDDTDLMTVADGVLTIAGELDAATLDISGNADIDGTLEADAYTVDGTALNEYISDTVGAMVSSNTETGISVTYEDGDNTIDFALAAAQTTITSIYATDLILGEDSQTAIDFGTANEIDFKVDNAARLTLTSGALYPVTDNQIDLGTSSLEFKDAFFDGTVTSDAFAGPLTGDVTGNVSGTAATVTTAAQSNITSLGTLTTLTVDNVIVNGTTIGHTSDTDLMTLASGGLTVAGTVAATGAVTANAGVVVDNITIDGSEIDLSSGDLTIDVAGDIILDADGGDIKLQDGGTQFGYLGITGSSDLAIVSSIQDKDIIFYGNDGGSTIAVLTLDMSEAGAATFNNKVTATELDISGNIDVDGTTNLDAVDVDGAVNFAADVTYADGADIITASAGTSNFRAGVNAGNSITSGGNYNTVIGDEAGTALTTGDQNVAVGYAALDAEDTGSGNTGIGAYALTAQDGAGYNTAVGALAGDAITVGDRNVALGYAALTANTVGDRNVAIGAYALYTNNPSSNEDSYNTAVGEQSGYATTTGKQNTFVGGLSGDANTTGDSNVALGYVALSGNTEGEQNIAIGENALALNTIGDRSTAVGVAALYTQNPATNVDMYNVAVGYNAGFAATTGTKGVYIGAFAGDALNTGANNICIGYEAGSTATDQGNNTFIGYTSGQDATSGAYLTSLGYQSLREVTSGSYNTAVGRESLRDTTIGERNTALGAYALSDNIDGHRSVAIGYGTLANSDPSSAGIMYNTAIGYSAGNGVTTGTSNVAAGALSGDAVTTGSFNCSFGRSALGACTEGDNNSTLGAYAGVGIDTGSNNLVLGKDAGRSGSPGGNITTASNEIALGDENISEANIQVDWSIASDERDKTDFTDLDIGLDFVKDLEPFTYKWDKRSKYINKNDPNIDLNNVTPDGTYKEDWLDIGFKAQSVEALEEAAGYSSDDKTNLTVSLSGDGKQYSLQYSKFVPILVKAVQELSATVETLQAEINALKEN